VSTHEAGTRHAVVELGGQGPLASSPRPEVSPCPSRPWPLPPQHLTVASSCRERDNRGSLEVEGSGESLVSRVSEGFHRGHWSVWWRLTRFRLHGSPALRPSMCCGG